MFGALARPSSGRISKLKCTALEKFVAVLIVCNHLLLFATIGSTPQRFGIKYYVAQHVSCNYFPSHNAFLSRKQASVVIYLSENINKK